MIELLDTQVFSGSVQWVLLGISWKEKEQNKLPQKTKQKHTKTTNQPTNQPASQPANQPTKQPTTQPPNQATKQPTFHLELQPTVHPPKVDGDDASEAGDAEGSPSVSAGRTSGVSDASDASETEVRWAAIFNLEPDGHPRIQTGLSFNFDDEPKIFTLGLNVFFLTV